MGFYSGFQILADNPERIRLITSDTIPSRTEKSSVGLGPGPSSAGIISAAGRMAADLKAQWFVLFVEDPKALLLPEMTRNGIFDYLRQAEELGAETIILPGRHVAVNYISEILDCL
jgi:K+-sensing histidine kinase KdpD